MDHFWNSQKHHKIYKAYIKSKNPQKYEKYVLYRNTLNKTIRLSKKNHYLQYFRTNQMNTKKVWLGIKEALNQKKGNIKQDIMLEEDGKYIMDQQKVANKFCSFYSNISTELLKKLPATNKSPKDFLGEPLNNSIYLTEIEEHEIHSIISSMDIKKSPDIYNISVKILKLSEPVITPYLAKIFNNSFNTGIFPDNMKLAKVIPLFKGGSKLSVNNYRPISLLPLISKILEKLMHQRLTSFLNRFDILFENQFGFQKGKSTSQAILSLNKKIIDAIEKKKVPISIFLDFAKAFDTVNHSILLDKLYHYGIRGAAFNWFQSYLSDRHQIVEVNGKKSNKSLITCGVPQGSILGPLLFILYVNDMYKCSNKFIFTLFADDTSLFYAADKTADISNILNIELGNVSDWLVANKLSLNVSKSNYIIFEPITCKHKFNLQLMIMNENLERVEQAKYLGVFIDKKLNWAVHINYINQKLCKSLGILSKLRHYLNRDCLKQIYFAFFQSHINYALLNWGYTYKTHLENIEISMNKAVRIMTFSAKDSSSLPLYNNLNLFTFDTNLAYNTGKFLWKTRQNFLPENISKLFTLSNVGTRQDFTLPTWRTMTLKQSFFYLGVNEWNTSIQNLIKNGTNANNPAKDLKSSLGQLQGFVINT